MTDVFLVVLYKESLKTSKTISSFLNSKVNFSNIKLIIWDNSPYKILDFDLLNKNQIQFEYEWTPENIPLSTIYNTVIETNKDSRLLFLFDQDSEFTELYFKYMYDSVRNEPNVKLFIPSVFHNNKLVSPGRFGFYKGMYLKHNCKGKNKTGNIIAIASGMCIRFTTFSEDQVLFDENLSFYGIDTKFCLDYAKKNKHLYVINYSLKHDLSIFQEKEDINIKLKRMKDYQRSTRYIIKNHKNNIFSLILSELSWTIKIILYCMKNKYKKYLFN
ncbi:MAG: hypothetical protein PHE29_03870 [Tissierellia bacterium]|nr:hypothetical protein [Tissierellia bacterium]MDD4781661.1 hypothetical protein [Tissierellia bacterium]